MNVPTWAGFVADFPDDQVETPHRIEVYGGRNVAVALGEILAHLGCSRVSPPKSLGEEGWAFDFYDGRHRFWCRVQSFHPVFWLLFEGPGTKKGAAAHVGLWRKFGNALERDPRFHKILWRPFKDGPPEWDEVEATIDPPERTFDERFPPSEISPEKGYPFGCCGCWPVVIWIWFTLSGVTGLVVGLNSPQGRERTEDLVVGIVMLILCSILPVGILVETIRLHLSRLSGRAPE